MYNNPYNQNNDPTIPSQSTYPMAPPPPKKRSIFRWYWRQHPAVKIAIGCPASIVAAFVVLFLVIFVIVLATPSTWQTHASPQVAQATQTHAPAPTATPKPTPVPLAPTPTTAPVQQVQPTQPPVVQPTQPPPPPPPTCNGTVMDGICYNTDPNGGAQVYGTPSNFCINFTCIANFTNGTGYIVECGNQEWSHSGGKSGVCSRDGSVIATLYSH